MAVHDLPVVATLKAAMSYNAARSKTVAANIANVDTPGYVPNDLPDFSEAMRAAGRDRPSPVAQARTHTDHIALAPKPAATWDPRATPDSETTIDGNAVVLEEQIVKSGAARQAYETALTLYQKSLSLYRVAIKSPAR
ncbi:MAG: flagellar basal body protein [Caulobacterales bacterium]|nr:flagellar basal body protein [Caulobacterales bacterium]